MLNGHRDVLRAGDDRRDIYTVAGTGVSAFSGDGGPAISAELAQASDVALDGAGNMLIADDGNGRIRVVAG